MFGVFIVQYEQVASEQHGDGESRRLWEATTKGNCGSGVMRSSSRRIVLVTALWGDKWSKDSEDATIQALYKNLSTNPADQTRIGDVMD